ncbi:hypothetical protein AAFF_G00335600 [Aldrovandia affinis]|uniref:Uncharacterized protein n=1 Tax=Aldrovandia affinis TaxID=143900 RepID=A0AAD7WPP7_9TELE|nr:hypothetical protein AAFF_G00335600 [Aldrovandia affinis]
MCIRATGPIQRLPWLVVWARDRRLESPIASIGSSFRGAKILPQKPSAPITQGGGPWVETPINVSEHRLQSSRVCVQGGVESEKQKLISCLLGQRFDDIISGTS